MERKSFLASFLLLPFAKYFGRPSTVVDKACRTQADVEGPFYKEGAPLKAVIETDGEALTISGRVFNSSDCSSPVVNATLDLWHCNSHGTYDNEGYKCRGVVKTDSQGRYTFRTIFPPSYGSRPRHIHFKVKATGFSELTSQIYFKGDPQIQKDFARNAEAARVIALTKKDNELYGNFDIYI